MGGFWGLGDEMMFGGAGRIRNQLVILNVYKAFIKNLRSQPRTPKISTSQTLNLVPILYYDPAQFDKIKHLREGSFLLSD